MSEGVKRIMLERGRQVSEEGYTSELDDTKINGALAIGAALYALPHAVYRRQEYGNDVTFNEIRPVGDLTGKHSRLRQLEIAGALIAAEIDRLVRAGEGGI